MSENKFKYKKVVISGYYGFDNFGDEAILIVLVRELKKLIENIEIVVLSKHPEKTSRELNVKAIDRMNFWQVISEISTTNLLISGGGSLLQDATSKLTIFYYLLIIFIAQILRVKTCIFAQGIGPINRKISILTTEFILKKVNYISVRDEKSFELLTSLNIKSNLTADPVWLGISENKDINSILKEFNLDTDKNIIGINLRPWNGVGMLELQDLARGLSTLASKKPSNIVIIPLHFEKDISICKDFYNILLTVNPDLKVFLLEKNLSPVYWDVIFKACNQVIAMRFHALVCAILHDKELFGISYDPKVENLMNMAGAFYVNIDEWKENKLIPRLNYWHNLSQEGKTYKFDFNKNADLAGQNLLNLVRILEGEAV